MGLSSFFVPILQVKYPSALKSFEQIMNKAKGKRIALFLDYDGTLSPIVDNPDCAFMSEAVRILLRLKYFIFTFSPSPVLFIKTLKPLQMRAGVKKVAKYFPTAIISGRSRDKVTSC